MVPRSCGFLPGLITQPKLCASPGPRQLQDSGVTWSCLSCSVPEVPGVNLILAPSWCLSCATKFPWQGAAGALRGVWTLHSQSRWDLSSTSPCPPLPRQEVLHWILTPERMAPNQEKGAHFHPPLLRKNTRNSSVSFTVTDPVPLLDFWDVSQILFLFLLGSKANSPLTLNYFSQIFK